ncbi:hypothetical protein TNCV_1221131 [Trichonephila clavipes]|nr:hypothetical protein TNCV_1221131 [Trichonephila clavipes]
MIRTTRWELADFDPGMLVGARAWGIPFQKLLKIQLFSIHGVRRLLRIYNFRQYLEKDLRRLRRVVRYTNTAENISDNRCGTCDRR